jgi:RHS repeat-associated protein
LNDTIHIHDGWRVIQERDGSNNPLVSYARGNDLSGTLQGAGGIGGLLARSDGYSSGNFTTHNYYFCDGNGNITCMLDYNPAKVASYRYDPFGNTISKSGTLADANLYRFSSKETHFNSGIYYYGYRFYDPNLQRWMNRDPIGERGGVNLYEFVRENPIGLIDTLGLADSPVHSDGALPNPVIPPNWPRGQRPDGLANPVSPTPSPRSPGTGSPTIVPPDPGGTGYMDNGSLDTASAAAEVLNMASEALDNANFNLLYKQALDKCRKTPGSSNGASKCCVVTLNGQTQIATGTTSWNDSSGYVADKPCCQAEQDNNAHGGYLPSYGPNTEHYQRYVKW